MTAMKKILLTALLLLFSMILMGQELPEPNKIVLEEASKNLGKMVGNGACQALINHCLLEKDHRLGRFTNLRFRIYDDKRVGKRVKLKNTLPGDIIFFDGVETETFIANSHVAVIKSYDNGVIVMYEQNTKPSRLNSVVVETTFEVKDIKKGKIKVYRPN